MVKRNSFTKFMLIVCGIILVASVFSGCLDQSPDDSGDQDQIDAGIAYAQTTGLDLTAPLTDIEKNVDKTNNPLKGNDINELSSQIRTKATLIETIPLDNGMKLDKYNRGKTTFEITGTDEKTPYDITVKHNKNKRVYVIDNHGNKDIDEM